MCEVFNTGAQLSLQFLADAIAKLTHYKPGTTLLNKVVLTSRRVHVYTERLSSLSHIRCITDRHLGVLLQ